MKKKGAISDWGEVTLFDESYNPHVNVYDTTEDNAILRTVEIECPGVEEEDIEWEERDNGILVTLEKKKRIDEGKVEGLDGHKLKQTFGIFKKQLSFPDGPWVPNYDAFSMDLGIFRMFFKKSLSSKKGRFSKRKQQNQPHHYDISSNYAPSESGMSSASAMAERNHPDPERFVEDHCAPSQAGLPARSRCVSRNDANTHNFMHV